MKGYVYIANTSKPVLGKRKSKEVKLTNMSLLCIKPAVKLGYEAFVGLGEGVEKVVSPVPVRFFESYIYRNPLAVKDNYRAFKALTRVIKENNVEVIHCNTPVGGLIGRLAGKRCKVKKVIYQAHGFHFYKGAPLLNWLLYYPVERLLAHFTDAIITINNEDYERAKKLKLRNDGKVFYVPGVGINTQEYRNLSVDRLEKRKEINVSQDDFVFLSVGRLDTNKNNKVLIEAVAKVNNPKVKLVLCGDGKERSFLEDLSKTLGVENQIIFLGNRTDMKEIYSVSDCLLMASFREGLSRTIMEAMSSGLPCVVSNIRGNVDLIEDGINGYLCNPADAQSFADAINNITTNDELREKMSNANLQKIMKYDVSVVEKEITEIYKEVLNIGE